MFRLRRGNDRLESSFTACRDHRFRLAAFRSRAEVAPARDFSMRVRQRRARSPRAAGFRITIVYSRGILYGLVFLQTRTE